MLHRRGLLAAPALLLARPAAAETWPQRSVRVIVPFSAGSTVDQAGRAVAPHFTRVFNQPFVVENRTGGGGTIGIDLVAKATDGHTLGVSTNGPTAVARALYRNLPYDPLRDLRPVSLLVQAPQILGVPMSSPVRSVPELIALARRRPGALTYGSVGVGASSHLSMEAFKGTYELDIVHSPYRGFPEATLDLVAGRIDAMFAIAPALLEGSRDGRLRALAVTSPTRFSLAPEIPTLREQGINDLDSLSWTGLVAPASLPDAVVARLSAEAKRALSEPTNKAALERAGFEVVGSTPAEFAAMIRQEVAESTRVIERLGIQGNV